MDRWVATTVKIDRKSLESAAGLRIGIVPTRQGDTDAVQKDDAKNLVICPLLHDESFMQIFYEAWRIVQAFMKADANIPREVELPLPHEREVARILAQRRDYPVLDVIDAIEIFGQPELLVTDDRQAELHLLRGEAATDMMVAPMPRGV